jgi:hypothetical protein
LPPFQASPPFRHCKPDIFGRATSRSARRQFFIGPSLAAMRQRPLVIGHRAEIAPINPTAARFTREKCPASSVGRMPRSKSLRAAPSGKIRRTRQSARRRCAGRFPGN